MPLELCFVQLASVATQPRSLLFGYILRRIAERLASQDQQQLHEARDQLEGDLEGAKTSFTL